MFTSNGIWFQIALPDGGLADGGVQESLSEQGPHAVVAWKCRWADRYNFMAGLRGGIENGTRVPPSAYPYSPNLHCTSISGCRGLKPIVDANGFVQYEFAVVTAEYGIFDFDFDEGDPAEPFRDPSGKAYTTTRTQLSAQVFTPPTNSFFWEDGPDAHKAVQAATTGFISPKTEYTITRHWMATVDQDTIDKYIGTLNDDPVTIGTRTYGRGTLLFLGGSIELAGISFVGKVWNYVYTMIGNGWGWPSTGTDLVSVEWNQFIGRDGQYHYISDQADGTGNRPYPYTQFWSELP